MRTAFAIFRSLLFGGLFVLLWGWVALSIRGWDSRLEFALPRWTEGLGLLLMACGAVLALFCILCFAVIGRGTPAPFDAPRQFVAAGPYKYVRNPMYIGGWLLLCGFGLALGSPTVVIFSFIWCAAAHLFVVGYEEPALRRQFGHHYEEYRRSVPRWIPARPKQPQTRGMAVGR